jgi:hypothetical protein
MTIPQIAEKPMSIIDDIDENFKLGAKHCRLYAEQWAAVRAIIEQYKTDSRGLPLGLISDLMVAADLVRNRYQSKEVADRLVNYADILTGFNKQNSESTPQPSTDVSELVSELEAMQRYYVGAKERVPERTGAWIKAADIDALIAKHTVK